MDIPDISTPRANGLALSDMALDGLKREKAMHKVFYDFASNILNHATTHADLKLIALLEKARAEWQEAVV